MDHMMERTVHRGMTGVTLRKEVFTDLDFADDVCLLAEMLEVLVLALTVMKEEASTFGLQINWSKTKILQVPSSTCSSINSPGGRWTCWSCRCICVSGMLDWLLWWQQRSNWLSSVLREYAGEEDLEVKHQAGNQVAPLSDIHCASFDVWVWDLGHHKYLLSRLDVFDTWALRKIFRIPYTRHLTRNNRLEVLLLNKSQLSSLLLCS